MTEEKNDTDTSSDRPQPPTRYFLVGMGRDAATRVLRRQNRGKVRGRRKCYVGPYLVRPNRAVSISLEQVEAHAAKIREEVALGRLQLRDGDQHLVDLDVVLGMVEPMPDLSGSSVEELVSMMTDAAGDPPLLKHVKAALVEKVVSNVKQETNLEGLEEFAGMVEKDQTHPLRFAEVELALAERIKELRDLEAGDEEPSEPTPDPEPPAPEPEPTPEPEEEESEDEPLEPEEDEAIPPYAEWDYADLKAAVKERDLETDSMKKDDLIAALELDDEED